MEDNYIGFEEFCKEMDEVSLKLGVEFNVALEDYDKVLIEMFNL